MRAISHRLHLVVAEDLDRRGEEAQHQPLALAARRARGVFGDDLDVAPYSDVGLIALEERAAQLVELDVGRVDDDVGVWSSPSSRSSGFVYAACAGPRRPSTTISSIRLCGERLERVIGDVGRAQLVVGQREHPRNVERDVAVADHDRARAAEVKLTIAVVRMAVVPGDELRRGVASGQLLAGDPEPPVGRRADRVQHRMVVRGELLVTHVQADLDVPVEAKARQRSRLLIHTRDGLDVRVIGRDARAHQPPRRGQALEHLDLHRQLRRLQQLLGRIEPRRPRADDRDPQRILR